MSVGRIRKELGCLYLCVSAPVGMLGLLVVDFQGQMQYQKQPQGGTKEKGTRLGDTQILFYRLLEQLLPTIVSSFSPTVHSVFFPASQNQCLLWYSDIGLLSLCSYLEKTQQALSSWQLWYPVTSSLWLGFRVTSLMPDKEPKSDKGLEYPAISPR